MTVFVDRWRLAVLEKKDSWFYLFNGIVMMLLFFVARILFYGMGLFHLCANWYASLPLLHIDIDTVIKCKSTSDYLQAFGSYSAWIGNSSRGFRLPSAGKEHADRCACSIPDRVLDGSLSRFRELMCLCADEVVVGMDTGTCGQPRNTPSGTRSSSCFSLQVLRPRTSSFPPLVFPSTSFSSPALPTLLFLLFQPLLPCRPGGPSHC